MAACATLTAQTVVLPEFHEFWLLAISGLEVQKLLFWHPIGMRTAVVRSKSCNTFSRKDLRSIRFVIKQIVRVALRKWIIGFVFVFDFASGGGVWRRGDGRSFGLLENAVPIKRLQ